MTNRWIPKHLVINYRLGVKYAVFKCNILLKAKCASLCHDAKTIIVKESTLWYLQTVQWAVLSVVLPVSVHTAQDQMGPEVHRTLQTHIAEMRKGRRYESKAQTHTSKCIRLLGNQNRKRLRCQGHTINSEAKLNDAGCLIWSFTGN